MQKMKAAAIAAVAFGGFAGQALAQDMDLMAFADADKDGKVTTAEYASFSEQGWGFFAQGADKVKPAELDDMAKGAFNGIAPDAQGYVTHAVYTAAIPARFKAADKNGDGTLDGAELNATMAPSS
jgi:hypothetical protein